MVNEISQKWAESIEDSSEKNNLLWFLILHMTFFKNKKLTRFTFGIALLKTKLSCLDFWAFYFFWNPTVCPESFSIHLSKKYLWHVIICPLQCILRRPTMKYTVPLSQCHAKYICVLVFNYSMLSPCVNFCFNNSV